MDAPLIIRDPSANTTDVYAFVDEDNGNKHLTVALGVYPHQEPGIGPNKYNFDDDVLYQIHVALGKDVADGKSTVSYQFRFKTEFKNENTVLQSYLGVVQHVGDAVQNLTQTYTVTRVDNRKDGRRVVLGTGTVPPNNQGNATPFYNQGDNGESRERRRRQKRWIATPGKRSRILAAAIVPLPDSATTGFTRTSSPSSTCSPCAVPARIRRPDSTST
jgi:hypothetical protein